MKPIVTMILAACVAACLTTADNGKSEPSRNGPPMSQSELTKLLATLRDQLVRCWAPPMGTGVPPVKVAFELNQEGGLASDPVVLPVNPGDMQNAQFDPAAKSALRAVRACTPLRLPPARYDVWKEVEIVFDPRVDPKARR
jgi:colicin import membrane protein